MIELPLDDPVCAPFWQAAQEERLLVCWCQSCVRTVWYPQSRCPVCRSVSVWREVSGFASLVSWTQVVMPINPEFPEPYITGLVVLEEAPTMRLVTGLVDCREQDLRCDMALEVRFRPLQGRGNGGHLAPVFTPRDEPKHELAES